MSKVTGQVHSVSEGGVAADHPGPQPLSLLAGPSTTDQQNTIKPHLFPIACWQVGDIRFAFDSSFVQPDVKSELTHLANLITKHPESPLSIFGHADPTGNDDYNKQLSSRRATTMFALLISNTAPDDAVRLWEQVAGEEHWGAKETETMQSVTGLPKGTPRKSLFKAYMQQLCGPDLRLDKNKDFLARGTGANGKGDLQGCSEFNPLLIFSRQDQERFEQAKDKTDRNAKNAPNRRVMVLLFRKGSKVDPAKWPCPSVKEGVAACKKRFWSDGEARRNKRLADQPRKYEETKDTFACRFYDRLTSRSPCERILRAFRIRLFDRLAQPIPGAPFITIVDGRESPLGRADAKGDIVLHDVQVPSTVKIRWSRRDDQRKPEPSSRANIDLFEDSLRANGATDEEIQQLRDGPPIDDRFEFENDVVVDIQPEPSRDDQVTAKQVPQEDQGRLRNMGYASEDESEENLSAFQRDCEVATGKAVDDVTAELRKRHLDCDPPARSQKKA